MSVKVIPSILKNGDILDKTFKVFYKDNYLDIKMATFNSSYKSNRDDTLKFVLTYHRADLVKGDFIEARVGGEKYTFVIRAIRYSQKSNLKSTTVSCATQYYKFNTYFKKGFKLEKGKDIKDLLNTLAGFENIDFKNAKVSEESGLELKKDVNLIPTKSIAEQLQALTMTDNKKVKTHFFYVNAKNVIFFEKLKEIKKGVAPDYEINASNKLAKIVSMDYTESDVRKLTAAVIKTNEVKQGDTPKETHTDILVNKNGVEIVDFDTSITQSSEANFYASLNESKTETPIDTADNKKGDFVMEKTTKSLVIVLSYIFEPLEPNKLFEVKGTVFSGIYRISEVIYNQVSNRMSTTIKLETSEEQEIDRPTGPVLAEETTENKNKSDKEKIKTGINGTIKIKSKQSREFNPNR